MKKQIIFATVLLCLALLLGGCEMLGARTTIPAEQEKPSENKTESITTTIAPAPTTTTTPSAKPVDTITPAPTTIPKPEPSPSDEPTPPPTETTPPPAETTPPPTETTPEPIAETSYAFIVSWGERMDPETDFAFDYVDWLFGEEAITMYMQDNEITWEEAEASIEEGGYIRNVNPALRWFTTTPESEYYMPDESMSVTPVKVGYDDFRNIMIPAIDDNNMALTFVKITSSGESILKIEWVFRP